MSADRGERRWPSDMDGAVACAQASYSHGAAAFEVDPIGSKAAVTCSIPWRDMLINFLLDKRLQQRPSDTLSCMLRTYICDLIRTQDEIRKKSVGIFLHNKDGIPSGIAPFGQAFSLVCLTLPRSTASQSPEKMIQGLHDLLSKEFCIKLEAIFTLEFLNNVEHEVKVIMVIPDGLSQQLISHFKAGSSMKLHRQISCMSSTLGSPSWPFPEERMRFLSHEERLRAPKPVAEPTELTEPTGLASQMRARAQKVTLAAKAFFVPQQAVQKAETSALVAAEAKAKADKTAQELDELRREIRERTNGIERESESTFSTASENMVQLIREMMQSCGARTQNSNNMNQTLI